MRFVYRDFNIECSVERLGISDFVSRATIWHMSSNGGDGDVHETGDLISSLTEIKALGHARNFAEIWCDKKILENGA